MNRLGAPGPITRDDIESKLREIQGGQQAGAEAARGVGRMTGVLVAAGAIGVAYLLGRRRGKKRRTIVEVRRV
ncbi:MAG: hypothetical protein FJW86_12315 [Actinobacteria bacterium]|nr:hypothetical protein [Actinomycetota bacterium]